MASAIKKRGGQEKENEAVKQGPIEMGEAVITTGGDLPAEYVIHTAVMGQDLHTDEDKVKKATASSLNLAEENELTSIALPAIGTGVGGMSIHLCAKIMLNESIDFLMSAKSLKHVKFTLFDDDSYKVFDEELRKIFSTGK